MRLAIVAYPQITDDDRRWIEDFRQAHDPQAGLIAAHFTLVFPVDVPEDELAEHARAVLCDSHAFSFVLGRARTVRSVGGQGAHVFLVPDHGASRIVDLHDRLYGGFLATLLRADIPFIPHITVAANADVDACERLTTILNEQGREIRGEVTTVDIVDGDGDARSLVHIALAS